MLELMDISSENVVALYMEGKLERDDIRRITEELDAKLDAHDRIRVYFEAGEFKGISARALWDDIRYGVRRFGDLARRVERVALVADQGWLRTLARLEDRLFPAVEERAFTRAEREEALRWIAQPTH